MSRLVRLAPETERGSAPSSLSGHRNGAVHVYPLRVFYEDTDAAGIVYYANYLKFIERARTELMRLCGICHTDLLAEHGISFIVRRCVVDYRRPARLDDLIEVHTRIISLKRVTIDAEQIVRREGDDLVRVELRLACIDTAGRPVALPPGVRDAFASLQTA